MTELNELIDWLREGVDLGHVTPDEALKWIGRRADEQAPSRLRPVTPAEQESPASGVRLKKDGTPWGKRGSKRKQTELPAMDGAGK